MDDKKSLDKPTESRKVIDGSVKVKKKNEIQKLADVFLAEDIADIKSYVKDEVVIPAIKKTVSDTVSGIFDIIRNSVDIALFGESGRYHSKSSSNRVSYNSIYDDRRTIKVSSRDDRSRSRFDYDSWIFESRGKIESVLDEMRDTIDEYGFVTVFDLYDFVGEDPPYTGRDYGWKEIRNVAIMRVREGYVLKLPKPLPIER